MQAPLPRRGMGEIVTGTGSQAQRAHSSGKSRQGINKLKSPGVLMSSFSSTEESQEGGVETESSGAGDTKEL